MHPKLIELEKKYKPSLLTAIHSPLLEQKQIELWIKRDDLIHPVISGNKWRKLKYILDHALTLGSHTIISMGGAYSNHLHALAFAGKQLGLKTIGYIIPSCIIPITIGVLIGSPLGLRWSNKLKRKHLDILFMSFVLMVLIEKSYGLINSFF